MSEEVQSAESSQPQGPRALSARSLSKTFGATRAVIDASLDIYPGEVHVLAGENGSGKSTLLRMLAGVIAADSGSILIGDKETEFDSVRDAVANGVVLIRQELSLVPELSVAENVFLGHRAVKTLGVFDRGATARATAKLFERFGVRLSPNAKAGSLRPDQQQLVEIARALSYDAKIVLMDEPTSSLDTVETDHLLGVVRDLTAHGIAVVFISHRTPEMLEIGDRFTVLRDGAIVARATRQDVSEEQLLTAMVGRHVAYPEPQRFVAAPAATPALELRDVADSYGFLKGIAFTVQPGEVVGLAGLVGAGRTELLQLIAGLRPMQSGARVIFGETITGSVPQTVAAGVVLVPEERAKEGIFANLSVIDNMLLRFKRPNSQVKRKLLRNRKDELVLGSYWIDRIRIKVDRVGLSITSLSGGNQQKVVLARALHRNPKILLLDEPTRGVDIGARIDIYRIVADLAAAGTTVLVASSELAELRAMANRVLVLHAGRIAADKPTAELDDAALIAYATGALHD